MNAAERAARDEAHLRAQVAAAPPLTQEQQAFLRRMFAAPTDARRSA